jgi:hypothetical protein
MVCLQFVYSGAEKTQTLLGLSQPLGAISSSNG